MSWSSFQTRVPGKWVLAGEHSVLRGMTAVALPHPELGLTLKFEDARSGGLEIEPANARAVVSELLGSVRDEWEAEDRSFPMPSGRLTIESTIPIGAGLGSSAALCVALTQWMSEPLSIPRAEWTHFATRLEHRFHGRSSGMDVAVISAGKPVSFMLGAEAKILGIRSLPRFTFHDTDLRARTSDCVLKVEAYRQERPSESMKIDEEMGAASRDAIEGLFLFDGGEHEAGLQRVARAMQRAQECFLSWQLVPSEAVRLQQSLLEQGALAAKMTGAGGGGMIVALWDG